MRESVGTTMSSRPAKLCSGLDKAASKVQGAGKDLRGDADNAIDNVRNPVKSAARRFPPPPIVPCIFDPSSLPGLGQGVASQTGAHPSLP